MLMRSGTIFISDTYVKWRSRIAGATMRRWSRALVSLTLGRCLAAHAALCAAATHARTGTPYAVPYNAAKLVERLTLFFPCRGHHACSWVLAERGACAGALPATIRPYKQRMTLLLPCRSSRVLVLALLSKALGCCLATDRAPCNAATYAKTIYRCLLAGADMDWSWALASVALALGCCLAADAAPHSAATYGNNLPADVMANLKQVLKTQRREVKTPQPSSNPYPPPNPPTIATPIIVAGSQQWHNISSPPSPTCRVRTWPPGLVHLTCNAH